MTRVVRADSNTLASEYGRGDLKDYRLPEGVAPELGKLLAAEYQRIERAEELLSAFGVSFDDRSPLLSFIAKHDPLTAAQQIALCRALGVHWSQVESTAASLDLPAKLDHSWKAIAEQPSVEIRTEGQQVLHRGDIRIRTFDCLLRPVPPVLAEKWRGTDGSYHILGLFLGDQEFEKFMGVEISSFSEHVYGSFAFLRYYSLDQGILVTELQSDVYGSLESRSLRERYKHWARLTLALFEKYIAETAGRDKPLLITDAAYQLERWPKTMIPWRDGELVETPGISAVLAKLLYEELPEDMGYCPETGVKLMLEHNLNGEPVEVKRVWKKNHDTINSVEQEYRTQADNCFTVAAFQSAQDLLRASGIAKNTVRPFVAGKVSSSQELRWNDLDLEESAKTFFEFSPAQRQPVTTISGITRELFETYRSLQEASEFPDDLRQGIEDTVLISKAQVADLVSSWREVVRKRSAGRHLLAVQLKDKDRHPELCIVHHDQAGILWKLESLGMKGAGVRAPTEGVLMSSSGEVLPFYYLDPQESILDSHRYWGGMSKIFAEVEFLNLVGVHHLMLSISDSPAAAPFPIQVQNLEQIPVWQDGKVSFLPLKEYGRRYLGGASPDLSVLLTYCAGDIRVAFVVNQVFGISDIEAETDREAVNILRKDVLFTLESLYALHGEKFEAPPEHIHIVDDEIGWKEIMDFLHAVYKANQKAAESIYNRIAMNSLRTLAAVHGAGGHLGGEHTFWSENRRGQLMTLKEGLGAVSGGAPAMRNMDVMGRMHDFDTEVYLPWTARPDLNSFMQQHHLRQLGEMQHYDALYWQDSIYWIGNLLFGRELKQGQILIGDPFGVRNGGIVLAPPGYDYRAEEAYRLVESRHREGQPVQFCNQEFGAVYSQWYGKGKRWLGKRAAK